MIANTSTIDWWRCLTAPALLLSLLQGGVVLAQSETGKRAEFLDRLIPILHLEADEISADPRISTEHKSWTEWLKQTGELPPDFDRLPACAGLPDPLTMRENGREIQITDRVQWQRQRTWIREQLQHWVYGSMPPAPGNVRGTVLSTRKDNRTTIQEVELAFGPQNAVKMTMELIIPDGPGPFPAFLTQWNHRGWAQIAVRRGYLACIYAGADAKDDTFEYRKFYPDYDFLVLARRAWGASRCIDYLCTLPQVDTQRIALAGHSRNGKQSLIAAAFDERIKAVISSSSGTGGEMPARFDRDHFYAGDMSLHSRCRRSWFHPRWRFFVGRENQLPVDSNSLIACIAPNACMISTATNETEANNWAQEQAHAILGKYSHMHGLMPQLGFFLDAPKRVPYDFHEVLGLVAPRPLMVVAPELDWDNVQADVRDCVKEAEKVYRLLGAENNLHLFAAYDINRWTTQLNPPSPQKEVFEWMEKHFR